MAVPTFHALYAAGFFGAASPSSSPLPWPSSGYTRLGAQLAPCGVRIHDAAGFASCCGPLACTLPKRARPRAPTPRSPQTPAGCYEGDLVPPSAGLAPASHRELDRTRCTRLRPRKLSSPTSSNSGESRQYLVDEQAQVAGIGKAGEDHLEQV